MVLLCQFKTNKCILSNMKCSIYKPGYIIAHFRFGFSVYKVWIKTPGCMLSFTFIAKLIMLYFFNK